MSMTIVKRYIDVLYMGYSGSMSDISFRVLGPADHKALQDVQRLYAEVFEEEASALGDAYASRLLEDGRALFFVVEAGDQITGAATVYVLPSLHGEYNEMYIYDMAVASAQQRQGVGSHLLTYIKQYCKTVGVKILFVQADASDMNARSFYRKNGGIEEDVRHYDFTIS